MQREMGRDGEMQLFRWVAWWRGGGGVVMVVVVVVVVVVTKLLVTPWCPLLCLYLAHLNI